MPRYLPSTPEDGEPAELATLLPHALAMPEQLVYEYVRDACAAPEGGGLPRLGLYADRPGEAIPVTRGWPAYPGKVPAIGVAAGPETEDESAQATGGGFAGTMYAHDPDTGAVAGTADYYAEPLYATVVVTLIHENRDERDRLHDLLRLTLFPLRRYLPGKDVAIKRVKVDGEKTEQSAGPPVVNEPFHLYLSVFTVHVYHEMLEATDVRGPSSVVQGVDVVNRSPLAGGGALARTVPGGGTPE